VLGLARREGNRRSYDVLERLLPADLLAQKVPLHEQLRHKMHSRYLKGTETSDLHHAASSYSCMSPPRTSRRRIRRRSGSGAGGPGGASGARRSSPRCGL
jgi:hypothetical protein